MSEWTDEELVSYIETHSHSELALVSNDHVRRFLKIAGRDMPAELEPYPFIACRYDDIKDLLWAAKRRMRIRLVPSPGALAEPKS